MRCPSFLAAPSRVTACSLLIAAAARAQLPAPPAESSAPPPYGAPTIALAQPPAGGTVPRDRPVVVFRFAAAPGADPLDLRSFTVAVDGQNRTSLFHVTAGEAWGPLVAPDDAPSLSLGTHAVTARICTARGACTSEASSVAVADTPAGTTVPARHKPQRAQRLDLLLRAAHKLLGQ